MSGASDALAAVLSGLASGFETDELAFLALTSKIELAVRDRLAFRLHLRLSGDGLRVGREWGTEKQRTDLVVFDDLKPRLLLELKAMYTFDATGTGRYLRAVREMVRADCAKALRLAKGHNGAEVYTLLLATHPEASCPSDLGHIIKYQPGINRGIALGVPFVRTTAANSVRSAFSDEPLALHGSWHGGIAFSIPVSVDFWLFGPYRCEAQQSDAPPEGRN